MTGSNYMSLAYIVCVAKRMHLNGHSFHFMGTRSILKKFKYGVLKPCFSFVTVKAQAWLAHSKEQMLNLNDTG
jgi:hypothetical protein